MKTFSYCLLFLIISSCNKGYKLFQERNDNNDFFGAEIETMKNNNKIKSKWILAVRFNEKQKIHDEYHINRLSCDTILKKIFNKRNVKVLILTNDMKFDFPVTKEDKILYDKLKTFIVPSNSCYLGFVDNATGYKLIYDGKQNGHL